MLAEPPSPSNPYTRFPRALFMTTWRIAVNNSPYFAELRSGTLRDTSPLEDHRMYRGKESRDKKGE